MSQDGKRLLTVFEENLNTNISYLAFVGNGVQSYPIAIGIKNTWDISMTVQLSEEEMRRALFGSSEPSIAQPPKPQEPQEPQEPTIVSMPRANARPRKATKSLSPKLRVTLHVTKVFESDTEILIYDANTLSTFVAEQEAKAEAKKKKYKYIEVVSIKSIG